MPKISIDHQSSISAQDAMSKIKTFFESDKDLQHIDPKISCQFDEKSMKGKVTGSQFKADVTVQSQGAGSQVTVVVDLPLLLTPFKGKVEETVKRKLSKYLA